MGADQEWQLAAEEQERVDAAAAAAATAGSDGQSERQEKARAWPRRYVRLNLPLMPSHSHTYASFSAPARWSDACMVWLLLLLLLPATQVVVEHAGAERLAAGLNSGKIGEMQTGEELDVRGPRLGIPIGKMQKKRGQFSAPSLRVRSSSLRTFGSVQ